MSQPRTTGRREWMWRCLLVLVSTSLTLCALELTLRLVLDRYRCDDRLGWTYQPGKLVLVFNWTREFVHFVRFNRDGLRDREPPMSPDVNAFRIVLLGDSFSAGLQVPAEESFPKLVERRLGAAAVKGTRIEVWNAAVDGFGTAQSLRMFVDRVARYEPKVVFLGVFLANDLGDNVLDAGDHNHYLAARCGRPYFKLDPDGRLIEIEEGYPVRPPSSPLDRLLRRSELYANLFPLPDGSPSASFSDWDVFTGRNADAVKSAWSLTKALARELDRQVQAQGGRLIVILMPHEQEARSNAVKASSRHDGLNFDRTHELAEAYFRESGIRFIDLYPILRSAIAKGDLPYFRRDMHWNSLGHEIVAEAIQRWLVDHCAELSLPLVRCRL